METSETKNGKSKTIYIYIYIYIYTLIYIIIYIINFTRHEQVLTWRDKLIILWTLNRQTKLFLRNSPVFKLFAFLQIRQVENMRMNLRQYQTHNVVQNSESQPKGLLFSKGIFSGGLYSVPFIIERLSFQMRRLEKEWVKQLGVGTY